MVYEVKCSQCGKLLSFGGEDPEENKYDSRSKLPENAIEFDGDTYCRECVEEFVQFGIGNVSERIDDIEDSLREMKAELGFEPD